MNLIFQIIRKDLRRLKWLVAAWTVWVLARVGLAAVNLALGGGDIHARTTLLDLVFYNSWFSGFLIFALVALVIQQDPLVGTSTFWITRPISPRMLMTAKGLLIGFFFVLFPMAADALTLSLENVTLRDILLSMPDQFLLYAAVVIFAAMIAVVTPHFGIFAPVMAASWYVSSWFRFPVTMFKSLDYNLITPFSNYINTDSQLVVIRIMVIALGLALIWFQFKTRDTRKTIALLVLTFLSLGLPQFFLTWDFTANPKTPVSRAVLDTDKVDIGLSPHSVWLANGDWAYPRPLADYSAQVTISGAAPDQEIRLVGMKTQMTFNNGQTAKDFGWEFYPKLALCDTPDARAVQGALGDIKLLNMYQGRSDVPPIMRLSQKIYKQFEKETATYQADMSFNVFRYKPEAEIPLETGAGYRSGSQSVTVTDITPQSLGINVEIQEEVMHLSFNHDPNISKHWIYEEDNVTYVLVNKKRKEAYLPNPLETYLTVDQFQSNQPLRVHRSVLTFSGINGSILEKDWLQDAVLMRIRLEPEGSFSKTITRHNFTVEANDNEFNHYYGTPEKWGVYMDYRMPIRYGE